MKGRVTDSEANGRDEKEGTLFIEDGCRRLLGLNGHEILHVAQASSCFLAIAKVRLNVPHIVPKSQFQKMSGCGLMKLEAATMKIMMDVLVVAGLVRVQGNQCRVVTVQGLAEQQRLLVEQ